MKKVVLFFAGVLALFGTQILCSCDDDPTYEKVFNKKEENSSYDFVDLGLPSGNKWADKNVGATSPTDCGMYYSYASIPDSLNLRAGESTGGTVVFTAEKAEFKVTSNVDLSKYEGLKINYSSAENVKIKVVYSIKGEEEQQPEQSEEAEQNKEPEQSGQPEAPEQSEESQESEQTGQSVVYYDIDASKGYVTIEFGNDELGRDAEVLSVTLVSTAEKAVITFDKIELKKLEGDNMTPTVIKKFEKGEGYTYTKTPTSTATWSLPTAEDLQELIDECEWTWEIANKGYRVTGKNGNSIFIPAAGFVLDNKLYGAKTNGSEQMSGYIWSSTPDSLNSERMGYLVFYSTGTVIYEGYGDKKFGLSVRFVQH